MYMEGGWYLGVANIISLLFSLLALLSLHAAIPFLARIVSDVHVHVYYMYVHVFLKSS